MKINLIGMILNNCGRRAFDGAILDDNGKPMSAADSLHTMILEYAKVIHGGESSLVTTSREVTAPATQEHRRDHAFQGPPMTSELTKAAQQALDTAPAPAVPMSEVDLQDDDALRFAQRVLESDAPESDRKAARDMLVAIRTRVRKARAALTAAPTPPAQSAKPELPIELADVSRQIEEGKGFWRSCTGCHELNEGAPTGPFSQVFQCNLGMGCSECGGLGAIWDDTDYEGMAAFMASSDSEPAQPAVPEDAARVNQQMLEALEAIASDYAERFDLSSPSTNPGIKSTIAQARAAIDAARKAGGAA